MEKLGTVKEISGSFMTVTIHRDSACGDNCAACGLCGNNREMSITLKNNGNFVVGDTLRIISDDRKFLGHSAVGYLSLTVLLIVGAVIGGIFGGDWFAFGGGLMGVLLGILILRLFFTDKVEITTEKVER